MHPDQDRDILKKFIKELTIPGYDLDVTNIRTLDTLPTKWSKYDEKNIRVVLGLDIFHYSQYELPKQVLIPVIFDLIYFYAIDTCNMREPTIFEKYDFKNNYISTGDGCFQIFNNPIQAITFNIIFHMWLRGFISNRFQHELSEYFNEDIIIRSCITFDFCYKYKSPNTLINNHYGTAIINNARIIAKDKLNRFLIDEHTYFWFIKCFLGIENIFNLEIDDIISELKWSPQKKESMIFDKSFSGHIPIEFCLVQKIGNIKSKGQELSVYNIQMQKKIENLRENIPFEEKTIVISIGNSNPSGITEE